jgi:hypothetical protein
MRVSLSLVFLFLVESCTQQPHQENQAGFAFDTTKVISLNLDSLRQKDIEMSKIYADSLNQWTGGALPKFLEKDIENEHRNLGEDVHHLLSFRKTMFDQVHNREVLAAILKSDNKVYSAEGQASRIPHSSLSLRDLAKMRYDELLKKE